MLRAGLVGLGMMGRHHARILQSLPGVELVAVADPGGDQHGVAKGFEVYATVEQLIAQGIDYCVIAAPTAAHTPAALELAAAGVHALIEKPLAQDAQSCQQLVDAFRGLVGGVGHIERHNPAIQQARKRLANGDLGEIYQVVTRRQGPFPARIADVGVVMDLATHDIDLTAWVTGAEYKFVSAQTAHRSGRDHEDLVSVTGRLSQGAVANHLVNWLSPFKERATVITGSHGAFVADTLTTDLTFYANGSVEGVWEVLSGFRGTTEGDVTRFAFPRPEPLRTEHEQFRDAVLGLPSDIATLEEGMRNVVVAEAILKSSHNDGMQVAL